MAKLTTADLTSLTSNEASAVSTINDNFAAVEAAMEKTLSRDGTTPNTMDADIDMNSNDLLNVGNVSTDSLTLNGVTITAAGDVLVGPTGATGPAGPAGAAGPTGATGATGATGPSATQVTAVSASGTAVSFTNIPSTAKRIVITYSGLSTNGTSFIIVRLGSTSFTTTGYQSSASTTANAAASTAGNTTVGMYLAPTGIPSDVRNGSFTLDNVSGNTWVGSGITTYSGINFTSYGGGSVTLPGTLDRVQLTMVNGTDTFDAGTVGVLYW